MADAGLSRREFLDRVGAASFVAALPAALPLKATDPVDPGDWDLSWVQLLKDASDRAVVDAPGTGDFPLQLATRYLDNCDAAYGAGKHSARVVVNLRTRGIAIGMNDALWERFSLGTEYDIKARSGTTPPVAKHNPFLPFPKAPHRRSARSTTCLPARRSSWCATSRWDTSPIVSRQRLHSNPKRCTRPCVPVWFPAHTQCRRGSLAWRNRRTPVAPSSAGLAHDCYAAAAERSWRELRDVDPEREHPVCHRPAPQVG